jgi:hypothetical protein
MCACLLVICCAWNNVHFFYVEAWILINACDSFMLIFELIIIKIRNQFRSEFLR